MRAALHRLGASGRPLNAEQSKRLARITASLDEVTEAAAETLHQKGSEALKHPRKVRESAEV
jgi:hypothetical protein